MNRSSDVMTVVSGSGVCDEGGCSVVGGCADVVLSDVSSVDFRPV